MSRFESFVFLWILSVFLTPGCNREAEGSPPTAPNPTLCGLPFLEATNAWLIDQQGSPEVTVGALPASFLVDNMRSSKGLACKFTIEGESVTRDKLFFRYGAADAARVRIEDAAQGGLRVTYPIAEHSYGLVSIEPRVEPPENHALFSSHGIRYTITQGAFLRLEGETPRIRSLGPDTTVELVNHTEQQRPVNFVLDNASDRLSRAVLTGLKPAKLSRPGPLAFRVSGLLAGHEKASLTLVPRQLPTPWSFALGGDIKTELGTFLELVEQLQLKEDPLFLLATGDFTRNSLPRELEAYFQRMQAVRIPVYPVKGNHEIRAQGRAHYPRLFGPDRYVVQVGGVAIVVLDASGYRLQSASVSSSGYLLGRDQLEWLDRTLALLQEVPYRMVALHTPPDPLHGRSKRPDYPSNLIPEDAKKLKALAKKHQVDYVLSGHAHLYARKQEANTVYLTSGGGGARLYSHQALEGYEIHTEKHLMVLEVGTGGIQERRITLPRPVKP